MRILIDQSAELTPGNITSHVYDDGRVYLELGTRGLAGQSVMIWAGTRGTELAEDARALRKLAMVASELADGLEARAGTGGAS